MSILIVEDHHRMIDHSQLPGYLKSVLATSSISAEKLSSRRRCDEVRAEGAEAVSISLINYNIALFLQVPVDAALPLLL